jgi:tellurium resistance protein TerD
MLQLTKGGKLDLSKDGSIFRIGLGWDMATGKKVDLDVSALILKEDGKAFAPDAICCYAQLRWPCNEAKEEIPTTAIKHSGDNRDGAGEGDDELITIDTSKLPDGVTKVQILVSIYEAKKNQQNFGMVKNAHVNLYKGESGTSEADILAKYDLEEDASISRCLIFCELYKKDGEWKFKAINESKGSFNDVIYRDILRGYGLDVNNTPAI